MRIRRRQRVTDRRAAPLVHFLSGPEERDGAMVPARDGTRRAVRRRGQVCRRQIAFAQRGSNRVAAEAFQVWKLTVDQDDRTAALTCEDGNGNVVYAKAIPCTDFPLPESPRHDIVVLNSVGDERDY
jgi:hypothetical protein